MHLPLPFTHSLKKFLPKSLFARALLILFLPVVLVQLFTVYIFFDRHWASVTRHLSASLAGEVAWVVENWELAETTLDQRRVLADAERYMGLAVQVDPPMMGEPPEAEPFHFPDFERLLRKRIDRPFSLRHQTNKELIHILIPVEGAMLHLVAPEKRLASPTTAIFLWLMAGASLAVLLIATLFLRNQIRPIVHLAEAAERFGRGQDTGQFRPSGAREVRQAGRAFLNMRDRIQRQVTSRTAMLSGISHDLRTPLTRLRLGLEMLPASADTADLKQDIEAMRHMIEEYLDFARGEGGEEAQPVALIEFLGDVAGPYLRAGKALIFGDLPDATLSLKPQAMKRALSNVIDNALRYGTTCRISAALRRRHLHLCIEDNGPGIPEAERESVFQAFRRLDESRNAETGGVGLGLTIVRDIVHAHGGDVALSESSFGGLKVEIKLPR